MCLDTVTSKTRDRKREGHGWKVFEMINGTLRSVIFASNQPRTEGVWLKSRNNKSKDYPLGFHIFRTREEARSWRCVGQIIRRVKFRDFLAEGAQGSCDPLRVIVAKEMLIL